MKSITCFFVALFCFCLNTNSQSQLTNSFKTNYNHFFFPNEGQIKDADGNSAQGVKFSCQSNNLKVFLQSNGLSYQFYSKSDDSLLATFRIDAILEGANNDPVILTEEQSSHYLNFYPGNFDHVYGFRKITYKNVYPLIDWVIYWNEDQLKYDFIVHPGGNYTDIKIKYSHADEVSIEASGKLAIVSSLGRIIEDAPICYQNGRTINSMYALNDNILSFNLEKTNPNSTLIIDPAIDWVSYVGGTAQEACESIAADSDGNVVTVGNTDSPNNIAFGGYQNSPTPIGDAYIMKFDSLGNLLWGTYYGGSWGESFKDVAINSNDEIIAVGYTQSSGLAINGWQDTLSGTGINGLILKLDPAGIPIWCTYYGTSGTFWFESCAIDSNDNLYVAGRAQQNPTMVMSGFQPNYGGGNADGVLIKMNDSGNLLWDTYYGGSSGDEGTGCAVDIQGNVFLTGETYSSAGIAFNGFQMSYGGGGDSFIVKFDSLGNRLWSTYYGNAFAADYTSCVADNNGNVYLASAVAYGDNLAFNGHQMTNGGGGVFDALLVKFDSLGNRLWATLYGGNLPELGWDCGTDSFGNVYLGGMAQSTYNIAFNGFQNTQADTLVDQGDAYIVKFNSSGVRQWGSYLGGPHEELGFGMYISPIGQIYLCGRTRSEYNLATGGNQTTYGGGSHDGYIAKINQCVPTTSSMSETACNSYHWMESGQTYTNSGSYNVILQNSAGCDSIITLNLTIDAVDNSITQLNDSILEANSMGAQYQWLDCNNNYALISGETSQSFIATSNGNYAVQITENGCIDTSVCIPITTLSIVMNEQASVAISPNPTSDKIYVDLNAYHERITIRIYSPTGQLLTRESYESISEIEIDINPIPGLYIVEILEESNLISRKRIIKI